MTKTEVRKYFTEKRLSLSPKQLEEISQSICDAAFKHYQLSEKKISLFLPIERKKEINTYKIWEKALSLDAEVAIPRVNESTNELKHILFESEDQLEISSFGIPEPKKGRVIAAEHFEIVFVPLLGVDKNGYRVGYGAGYYDRFLKKCTPRCKFIGLSHFDELVDPIKDLHEEDVPLHAVVTPTQIIRFE